MQREAVFVDTGAWIALALSRDPRHEEARGQWTMLCEAGVRRARIRVAYAFDRHFAIAGFRFVD